MNPAPRRGPLFWASAAAGWALILWGVRGALHHRIDTRPAQLARFLLGEPSRRQLPQLVINQWQKLFGCMGITLLNL